jgi:hypothetical protein
VVALAVKALAVDTALGSIGGDGSVAAGGDVAASGGVSIGLAGGGSLRVASGGVADERHHPPPLEARRLARAPSDRPAQRPAGRVALGGGDGRGRQLPRGRRRREGGFLLSDDGPGWLDERALP